VERSCLVVGEPILQSELSLGTWRSAPDLHEIASRQSYTDYRCQNDGGPLPKELISVVGSLKVRPPPCWMQGLVSNTGRHLAVNNGVQSPAADSDAVRSGRVPNVNKRTGNVAFWDRIRIQSAIVSGASDASRPLSPLAGDRTRR
jgi:hypothetical protein